MRVVAVLLTNALPGPGEPGSELVKAPEQLGSHFQVGHPVAERMPLPPAPAVSAKMTRLIVGLLSSLPLRLSVALLLYVYMPANPQCSVKLSLREEAWF